MNAKTALITGATSGIGAAFASKFASLHYDLIITGRRQEKLAAFAAELKKNYNVAVEVIQTELSSEKDLAELTAKIKSIKNLEILVNNAGFIRINNFWEEDLFAHDNMIQVQILAVMKLTYAALPGMIANRKGAIINVASIMAFFPFATQAIYAASKSFVSLFSETLYSELKNKKTGVYVQSLCPGPTFSDIYQRKEANISVALQKQKRPWLWRHRVTPQYVVEKSLHSMQKNRSLCIPGWRNKLIIVIGLLRRMLIGDFKSRKSWWSPPDGAKLS
jgi:uncharacterized protein